MVALRMPGAIEGVLSLVTAFLLARRLLPKGGATVAVLVLAGLRWELIIARFGWNGLALAPILDVATLFLLTARRRGALWAAAVGGLVAGIGAHVYLGGWIGGAALGGFLLWPGVSAVPFRRRVFLSFLFGLGFVAAASPIFLLQEGRRAPYFSRAKDQNIVNDIHVHHDWSIPFTIVADSLRAPWLVPDPERRQDLPTSRLGWIVGIPVLAGFLRAWTRPRSDLSALIFPHAGAAIAASLRWGLPGHPNGFRFVYLATVTAVVAADGVLFLVGLAPVHLRRAAAIAVLGLLAAGSLVGARQALFEWGEAPRTFGAYSGGTTLIARAQLRWSRLGRVQLDRGLDYVPEVQTAILAYQLDPEYPRLRRMFPGSPASSPPRCFRIAPPEAAARNGDRVVELVKDAWGREHGAVLAGRCPQRP